MPILTCNTYSNCHITPQHSFGKMENSLLTPHLARLFNLWNNAVHWINYWVCTAEDIEQHLSLGEFIQNSSMTTSLMQWITYQMRLSWQEWWLPWTLQFEKSMHYHDKGYESVNDYGLPPQVMRSGHIYLVFTTEASFNLAEYNETQHTISPLISRWSRSLTFHEGVHWHLTFNEIPPNAIARLTWQRIFPTSDMDDPVWSEEPVPDNWEYLCIHEIPWPATPPPQPNQVEMLVFPPPQPGQVEIPPEHELMELGIPEDMPDLINFQEEVLWDFDAWTHSVLPHEWYWNIY